jgi:glucose/arabinose dehydrogenase
VVRKIHTRIIASLSALWVAGAFLVACSGGGGGLQSGPPNPNPAPVPFRVETFLTNASFPVTMAFAPDGRLFFNELATGNIRIVQNGQLLAQPFVTLTVETSGERGLLGLAFDPNFAANRFVYVYYSDPGGFHRLLRFTDSNNAGTNQTTIFSVAASNSNHNGGNIAFGPDGRIYITVGDCGNPANSQSMTSACGKILRINWNGTIPADNPFGAASPAFNLGLRNSFDFTFHPQSGIIYASENGPNCDDEINRIVAAANYGWRINYPCGDSSPSFLAPITRFNPVIAPTGITFYTAAVFPQFRNSLFLVDFNTGRVRRFVVNDAMQGQVTQTEIVVDGGFGSLLDITQGTDGFLYFSSATSIMRIVPQ